MRRASVGIGEGLATIRCPRCDTVIDRKPDGAGLVVCSHCGAKLQSRPSASPPARAQMPPRPSGGRGGSPLDIDSMLDRLDGAEAKPPDTQPVAAQPSAAVDPPVQDPTATLPPGTPLKKIPRPPNDQPVPDREVSAPRDPLELVLREVRALRLLQEEILGLLRGRPEDFDPPPEDVSADPGFATLDEVLDEPPAPPVRTKRRKSVLLIDDDPRTREEAVAALDLAQIPVRTVAEGSAGLAAIAAEKPDVIVLELDIRGSMPGKDVVNMIKATMEWVDVPLILYTRAPIASQKDARTIHGADEYVVKGPTGAETLVAMIVATFRRT